MKSQRYFSDSSSQSMWFDDGAMAPGLDNSSRQARLSRQSGEPSWEWSDDGSAAPPTGGEVGRMAVSSAPRTSSAESTADSRETVEQLLEEHGFSNKLLKKLYKDDELMEAAFELEPFATPEDFFSELADKAVGARMARRMPKQAGEHFDDALDSFPDVDSSSEAFEGMRRTLMGMELEQMQTAYGLRFDHLLLDDSAIEPDPSDKVGWSRRQVRQLWDQLAVLPDEDVVGNERLDEMIAIEGGGGWYSPTTDTVAIGVQTTPKSIAHTIRHEIGHAVHEKHLSMVDLWLEHEIGFIEFDDSAAGFRQWVDELGGFPSTYRDRAGGVQSYDTSVIDELISALMSFTGYSWAPTRSQLTSTLPADLVPAWHGMPAAVRKAATGVTEYWWDEYRSWPKGERGGYFLNHIYGTPCCLSTSAYNIVKSTRDNYTAMSRYEFFANCYAEFFANKKGFIDPSKWGGRLPSSVKDFFRNHLLDDMPYTPPT